MCWPGIGGCGAPVRFLTGTDDNALKNVAAARAAGVPVAEFVARNAARFYRLREPLALSFDDFIKTSADPRHRPGVARLWRQCADRGDFYQRRYQGRYCAGCEQFYAPEELVLQQHPVISEPGGCSGSGGRWPGGCGASLTSAGGGPGRG